MAIRGEFKPLHTDLRERWKRITKADAPGNIPTFLLALAAAYREQANVHGGLKPAVVRQLLGGTEAGARPPTPKVQGGAILVREWHGKRHTVSVLDKGVAYNGKHYRSLSQVAKAITGNHWSGPAFFGLKAKIGPRHD